MADKEKSEKKARVKVRVIKQPVHEEGVTYKKGETFDTDEDRAKALGTLVVLHETKA